MKKQFVCISVMALILAMVLAGPAASQTIKLTYSIFFPPSHGQCQAAMGWAKALTSRESRWGISSSTVLISFPPHSVGLRQTHVAIPHDW